MSDDKHCDNPYLCHSCMTPERRKEVTEKATLVLRAFAPNTKEAAREAQLLATCLFKSKEEIAFALGWTFISSALQLLCIENGNIAYLVECLQKTLDSFANGVAESKGEEHPYYLDVHLVPRDLVESVEGFMAQVQRAGIPDEEIN